MIMLMKLSWLVHHLSFLDLMQCHSFESINRDLNVFDNLGQGKRYVYI